MKKVLLVSLIGLIAAGFIALAMAMPQSASVAAQGAESLSGIVEDLDGNPIAEAIVRVKLTSNHTISADDGTFTLTNIAATRPVTITAWADGFYVGFTILEEDTVDEPVTIALKPHYTSDNLEYDWFVFEGVAGSASCEPCHTANEEWKADAHSKSATNPRFLSIYLGTDVDGNQGIIEHDYRGRPLPPQPDQPYYGPGFKLDYPDRAGNCASCHTPLASNLEPSNTCGWSGCHTEHTALMSDEVPHGVSPTHLNEVSVDGISCEFCHKIGDVILDKETQLPYADKPGISSMKLYRPEEGHQLFFGTYDDVTRRVAYSPLQEESAYCAPCHYGVFGGVVGNNEMVGGVDVYNSYGEWLASPYSDPETGQTCQDCHMLPVENNYFVFPEKGGLERDYKPVHDHRMPGAKDEAFLRSSVTMTTTAEYAGDDLLVSVGIFNDNVGHHIPTGFPGRHMILLVEAVDAQGNVLAQTEGQILPDWTGNFAGQPGRYFAKILEDQWTGESPTVAYWRNIELLEDTRIAALETDVSQYAFKTPVTGSVSVKTSLIFRQAFAELSDLKNWDEPDILMESDKITVKAP